MTRLEALEQRVGVKSLSFLVAALIWVCVSVEQPAEMTLSVPVSVEHVAPSLTLKEQAPQGVELRVSGPRILLFRLLVLPPTCRIDLTGVGKGVVRVTAPQIAIKLDADLKVVRVTPEHFDLTLVPKRQ